MPLATGSRIWRTVGQIGSRSLRCEDRHRRCAVTAIEQAAAAAAAADEDADAGSEEQDTYTIVHVSRASLLTHC